jgi:hypothetical protein|tara:strand:+ start:302 stop:2554 length:2253 start_codon:yes stop_codon:yes gene_type:complete
VAEAQVLQEETVTIEGDGMPSARIERTVEVEEELDDAGLSEDQLKQLLSSEITDALSYVQGAEFIADERETAYEYYRGVMDDLPAPQGRSRVTDRAVSTYVNMMLPSLLRVFTAGKNIAVYEPVGEEDVNISEIITHYVNECVFRKDNRGEAIIRDWAWNALVGKVGVVKAFFEEKYRTEDEVYEDLNEEEFADIVEKADENPQLEIVGHEVIAIVGTDESGNEISIPSHNMQLKRTINESTVKIENLEWEEFTISRDARNLEDAVLKSHRTFKRAGDLIDMGYDEDVINNLPTYTNQAFQSKAFDDYYRDRNRSNSPDPMLREVLVHEGIIKCDYDGTGVKEWYFVAGGGENVVEMLKMEEYEHQIVFADFCPEPIPNLFFGRCPADSLVEIQRVNTVITRMMLDSGYLSLTPQREVVFENLVNPEQLTNMSPAAPVYVTKMGSVREMAVPFVGTQALAMLNHFEGQAEARTGVSKASMGLDPDVLMNQTATSANIAYSSSLGKVEMIARMWADGGMRKLFRGILKMLIKYQDFSRIVRMNGRAIKIDPRQWEAFSDMDVTVQTGLGTGNRDRDMAMISQIVGKQEAIIGNMGLNTPLVDLNKYSRALQDLAMTAGIKNPELYFGEIPEGFEMPQPPPKPDPQQMEIQRKAQKDQKDFQVDMMGLQLKGRELALKEAQVQLEAGQTISPAEIQKLQLQYEKMLIDAEIKRNKIALDATSRMQELEVEAKLEKYAIDTKSRSGQGIIPNK